ncbi:chorismate-binding protein [Nonlabens sp.]|uniref:chorismate-binding protein n=1 Tax=Nonlabens sp. TaxID=1888209 RepID=UPI003F6A0ABA
MRQNLLSYIGDLIDQKLPFFLLRKANDSQVRILSQLDQKWHKTAHDNMTCGAFSKFQIYKDQVFIYGEVDSYFIYENNDLKKTDLLKAVSLVDIEEQNRYIKLVEKAVREMKESNLKKVVLSRKQKLPKRSTDLDILNQLLHHYPAANCYFFYHPEIGKWMGATPETLVQIKDGKLETMSLAGTAIFIENESHIWGEKELEEQKLVTDFIVQNLTQNGAENIQKSEVKTVQAGNLIHLRTDITAKINQSDKSRFIEALHPTPAVCGLPRDKAEGFIMANEGYDRSFYTGYLGILENDVANYFVNLRCMEVHEEHVDIYVGGGITELSDPKAEFEETMNKLMTMKKLL